ncbi:DUF7344 domain-containing protein [Haladaptatus salinisoli]|uniref:DUF7344 domain-containing protein n=1 Tax=Haladaptatus salinisoli TaxID=2884876 RepID=UPI001D09D852|nr:ArsR family transcriptional regulator [Haladaptatus salinisoli]
MPSDVCSEKDPGAEPGGTATPELDALFTVLSNERRRETLLALRREDGALSLSDLVGRLQGGTDEQIRTSLIHAHLPMLEEIQLVRWDRARESVEMERFPEPYRELFATIDRTV